MDLESLRIFVEVVRRGSFSAVAAERGVAPSSISRTIESLERQLGARLFQRTTRRVSSTEAGAAYFEHIEPVVEEMERARLAVADLSANARGTLRLTASVSFGLTCVSPLLARFAELHPDLQVEVLLTDAVIDLTAERIDLALRHGPLADSSLVARKILPVVYSLCASPSYLDRHGRPETPADLKTHRCLAFSSAAFHSRWLLRRRGAAAEEISVRPRLVINNGIALKRIALDGAGIVVLSDWLIGDELRRGELVPVLEDYEATPTAFETGIWLIYPSRTYVPRKVTAFVDFIAEELGGGRNRADQPLGGSSSSNANRSSRRS
jgi:DNA-binding transcriptional LysR family regulator